MELAGPLGTLLGLAQWKRASSRGEAGTSGFLSVSDSDCTVPAVLGQESQASSCVEEWNSTGCYSVFCLLVSSVSGSRPDTKGAVEDTIFFFRLTCSVALWGGREGVMLQTNNTGVRSKCLSHTGFAPAHGACSLPAHTAWALGCSVGNNQRPALG